MGDSLISTFAVFVVLVVIVVMAAESSIYLIT